MSGTPLAPRRLVGGAGAAGGAGNRNRDRMSYYSNHNLAYDFSLFEEQPRMPAARGKKAKEKPAVPDSERKVNKASSDESRSDSRRGVKRLKRRKSNFARIAAGIVFGLLAVVIIASIIHGEVQLNELNHEIGEAESELEALTSLQTELEMKIAEANSPEEIDKYATDDLHMSKATASQKVYFSLREGDKAQVLIEEKKNIFERIIDAISSLWS